jgi:stage III sporulation protein AE
LVGFRTDTGENVNKELHIGESAEDILDEFNSVLPPEHSELLSTNGLLGAASVEGLFGELWSAVKEELSGAVSFFGLVLGAAIITSLSSRSGVGSPGALELGTSKLVALPLWRSLALVCESVLLSLREVSEFFLGASGVVCALTLSSGAAATAAVETSAFSLTLSVFGEAGGGILGALTSALVGSSVVGSALGGRCELIARGVRSVFNFGLGIVTAALVGLFSLQTLVAASSDSAALRAARYAASGMIPVVGNTVSGAISTLASGLSYVGGIIGASSVIVIVFIILLPAVRLLLFRLALSTVLVFLDFIDGAVGKRIVLSLRGALDSVSALYFLSSLVYVFLIVLFTKSVTGLL